jgi:type VI secretion system secreted protein VgrG
MIVALDCKLRDSYFKADEKLDSLKDVVLSIDGGFGSPEFFMTVYKYTLTHIPNNDVLDIQITLVDRYNRFREIEHKCVFYYSNVKDIYYDMYTRGFRGILDSNITPHVYFDVNDTNKYPRHPIYMQYNETNWEFFRTE